MENWMMWVGGIVSLPYLMMLNHKLGIHVFGRLLNSNYVDKLLFKSENYDPIVSFWATARLVLIFACIAPYVFTLGLLDFYVTRKILINDVD